MSSRRWVCRLRSKLVSSPLTPHSSLKAAAKSIHALSSKKQWFTPIWNSLTRWYHTLLQPLSLNDSKVFEKVKIDVEFKKSIICYCDCRLQVLLVALSCRSQFVDCGASHGSSPWRRSTWWLDHWRTPRWGTQVLHNMRCSVLGPDYCLGFHHEQSVSWAELRQARVKSPAQVSSA